METENPPAHYELSAHEFKELYETSYFTMKEAAHPFVKSDVENKNPEKFLSTTREFAYKNAQIKEYTEIRRGKKIVGQIVRQRDQNGLLEGRSDIYVASGYEDDLGFSRTEIYENNELVTRDNRGGVINSIIDIRSDIDEAKSKKAERLSPLQGLLTRGKWYLHGDDQKIDTNVENISRKERQKLHQYAKDLGLSYAHAEFGVDDYPTMWIGKEHILKNLAHHPEGDAKKFFIQGPAAARLSQAVKGAQTLLSAGTWVRNDIQNQDGTIIKRLSLSVEKLDENPAHRFSKKINVMRAIQDTGIPDYKADKEFITLDNPESVAFVEGLQKHTQKSTMKKYLAEGIDMLQRAKEFLFYTPDSHYRL